MNDKEKLEALQQKYDQLVIAHQGVVEEKRKTEEVLRKILDDYDKRMATKRGRFQVWLARTTSPKRQATAQRGEERRGVGDADFIVSVHALDRFQQRFEELWTSDEEVGHLIHAECEEAMLAGRASFIPPLELAHNDLNRWEAGKGLVVWTADKQRGYVLLETAEGMLVTTVLQGKTSEAARRMLYEDERKKNR